MQTGSSAAYDLSIYEPKEQSRRKPKLRVVHGQGKAARSLMVAKTVCIAVILLALVVGILHNKAELTQLSAQITATANEYTQLQSEYTMLSTQLESRGSLRSLEEYATTQLGMSKLDQDQVVYLDGSEDDKIEIVGRGEDGTLKETVSGIMEYLKLK